jgi:sugar phosphate permease
MKQQSLSKSYIIWVCVALFYLYQFILRVSPSVMLEDLMAHFQINATEMGALSAVAMYSYSLLQVPAGILVDIFGVRRVVLGSISLCILGVLIFISTDVLWVAKAGRFLLGMGSAAAFLSVSKVSTLWFSPRRRATLFGMTMAAGTIGALNGSAPLSYLVSWVGWKQSLLWVTGFGGLVFAINAFILKDRVSYEADPAHSVHVDIRKYFKEIRVILKSRACWITGLTALGIYLSISVLADLWGVSFLMHAYGMDRILASKIVSFIYVGLCVGSLSLTFLSDLIHRRKLLISVSTLSLVLLVSLVVYYPYLSVNALSGCLFLIGFFSGAEMLCFTSATESVDQRFAGMVTGFINCVVMLGGAFFQEQVGKILDLYWSGQVAAEGVRIYSLLEYQKALILLVTTISFSVVMSFFIPEKTES